MVYIVSERFTMKRELLLGILIFLGSGQLLAAESVAQEDTVSKDELNEQYEPPYLAAITDVIKNFKRRITFLEIGRSTADYTFELAPVCKAIFVALLVEGGAQDVVQEIKADKHANITVLAPRNAQYESFFTLGRCEHFDVVIVHDLCPLMRTAGPKYIDALVKLGDYVFIEATQSKFQNELKKKKMPLVASSDGNELYLSHKPKTGLDIARFTQKDRPVSTQPKYQIRSTFTEKFFNKKGLERPLKWVDGINLVTFAMLKGVYPEDVSIRKQLATMKKTHPDHNDLVLGNIIVQGDKLIPIDLHDSRRDADIHRCINAALKAFKDGNIRHRNPERWIREYYDTV